MAKYKAYPEYKDSGMEWLNSMPAHWTSAPIKYLALATNSLFLDGDWIESKDISDDGVRYITTGNVGEGFYKEQGSGFITENTFSKLNCTEVFEGDILISRLNNPIGRACLVPDLCYKTVTSVDNVIFRTDKHYNRKYLVYLFSSKDYFQHTGNLARGTTMQRISRGLLGNIRIPVPTLSEQIVIAAFLDHEIAKIDNLIGKQQQLIELLKEKRQAVISHAVTKGLNPDVPMKDSCVEWLGSISQECVITKLKYLTVLKTEKTVSNNIRYVGMENISSGTGKFLTKDKITPEGISLSFKCNDLLFGKLRPYLAKSWLATFSGICSSEFLVLQSKKIHAKYLNYYFLTNEFIKQVDSSTYGSKMPRANWDFISQLPVPTWSYEKSKAIAVYLDNLTAKLDWLLEKQNQQVNLLQERRTALISAAVTGKIDVRDWVAPDTQDVETLQEATA